MRLLGFPIEEPRRPLDDLEVKFAGDVGEADAHLRVLLERGGGPARGLAALEEALQDDVGRLGGRRGLGSLLGLHRSWKLKRLLSLCNDRSRGGGTFSRNLAAAAAQGGKCLQGAR